VLLAVIGADPRSLDPHQESTFANIELVAPLYSTLLRLDPYSYPNLVGDVATEWKIVPDGLTYTFKIRSGIHFHDGSPLATADVKATYDKIISLRRVSGASGRTPTRRLRGWRLPMRVPWSSS
jgi:peptide/nickel transport system substrate-binding protein